MPGSASGNMLNFHTFKIYRLGVPDGESGESFKREYIDTDYFVTGFLETAAPDYAAIVDGEFGKTFRLFSDDLVAPVQTGDRLIEGSTKYDVKGVVGPGDGPGRRLDITLTLAINQ